jgi:hypothetical protein
MRQVTVMGVPFNSSLIAKARVEKGFGAVIDRIEAAWGCDRTRNQDLA